MYVTEERLRLPFLLTLVPYPDPEEGATPATLTRRGTLVPYADPEEGATLALTRRVTQTAPKSQLFAPGFARFKEAVQPPDLLPDRAEMAAFGIGFCTLLEGATASGPASRPHRNNRFLHWVLHASESESIPLQSPHLHLKH